MIFKSIQFPKWILYLFLTGPLLLFGQRFSLDQIPAIGILHGTVLDSTTEKPIAYASISLIRLRDDKLVTGGITNDKGQFDIKEIPLGRYRVVVEFIGYEPVKIAPINLFPRGAGTEQDLGTIQLKSKTLPLEKVEVMGERPLFTHTVDKKVFNVEKNTLSTGGSALDVLRQIPGVDVDMDGNVSLRGNTNVNVLIDGKPSSLTGANRQAILENIPADNISDIEVITNPSAKYDPEGMAGIINIILKENRLAGLNGNISLGTDFNDKHNSSGQVNFRNERINLFTNLGLRLVNYDQMGDNYQKMLMLGVPSILDQDTEGDRGRNNIFLKSGFEFYPNHTNTLSLTATYTVGGSSRNRDVTSNHILDTLTSEYIRSTESISDRKGMDLTFSYDKKFPNPEQKFSALISYSTNMDDDSTQYNMDLLSGTADFINMNSQKTFRDRTNGTTNIQVDYVYPFNNTFKLETGYKATLRSIDDAYGSKTFDEITSVWSDDDSLNNHFVYNENIQAVYGQISREKAFYQYLVGLRVEHVTTTSELMTTGDTFENPYTSLFPSGSISLGSPMAFQIQTSYGRRINRPSFRRLNPFPSYSDRLNLRKGNPFLKPEYIDVIELNVSRFKRGQSTTAGVYYRRTTDKIRHYKYMQENGVSVVTYKNYNESRTFGAELIVSGRIAPHFRLTLSGNVYRDEVDASNVLEDYKATSTGYFARLMMIWSPTPTTELSFFSFIRGPRDIPIGRIYSMSFTSMSLKKMFLNRRLTLSLKVNDPFNTMGFRFHASGEDWTQRSSWKWESRYLTLNLEYHFGKMEEQKRHRRELQREENEELDDFGID